MTNMTQSLFFFLLVAGPLTASNDWTQKSNENAMVVLNALADFIPEEFSQFGIESSDQKVMDLKPGVVARMKLATREATAILEKRLEKETHPAIRQDLVILIESTRSFVRGMELNEKYEYGFFQLSQSVFYGIRFLLDDRLEASRYPSALVRLRKYAGHEAGYQPIATLARERMTEQRAKKGLMWPVKAELERYLEDSPRYLVGIEQLFKKFGIENYEESLQALKDQIKAYDAFLRTEYLPRARTDFRLPPELYAYHLEQRGVTMPTEELVNRAEIAFMEIVHEMNALTPMIAGRMGLETKDYRVLIRELKKKQFEGEDILPHYQARLKELENLIREHQIITLPDRPIRIRLASEAESAATPAPHMDPPRLIGNTGEVGDFVLPLKIPGKQGEDLTFDDFTFEAASWTLSVHEGRPGHELQFASIVERGVSIARTLFAFNSVNVEGWALYSEAVMKPFMPLEGQLISLQHRLLRAARAFLDPKLQLGQISPEQAKTFLMNRVVLSEALANQEVDRYTFRNPGQATSYFFGYINLMALRSEMELALDNKLNLQDFHDFILTQGLLPHHLLRKALMEEFLPAALAKSKGS